MPIENEFEDLDFGDVDGEIDLTDPLQVAGD